MTGVRCRLEQPFCWSFAFAAQIGSPSNDGKVKGLILAFPPGICLRSRAADGGITEIGEDEVPRHACSGVVFGGADLLHHNHVEDQRRPLSGDSVVYVG